MKNKTIGLMGCLTCNANMGSVALTYSLLKLLEKISSNNNYIIFDSEYDEKKILTMCEQLHIDRERVFISGIGRFEVYNCKRIIRRLLSHKLNKEVVDSIKKCNVIVDLTGGDSFTDIYGKERFYYLSSVKRKVEKLGVPLVLGPQTYGPFNDKRIKKYAKDVIEKARLVVSRDYESKKYVESFCEVNVKLGTDLAFKLPYDKTIKRNDQKICVGFNISGLLHSNKIEKTTLNYNLKTNYDDYVNRVLDYLCSDEKYEVHLIPHVGNDANNAFEKNDKLIVHKEFYTPIEAKNLISQMDIFIGSRMHATIGAVSSGVATIPVGYSRKFNGVFGDIDYPFVVDMTKLSTEESVKKTIEYLEDYKKLEQKLLESKTIVDKKYRVIEEEFKRIIN